MSFCPYTFDELTEKFAASTLKRVREFAQNTPLDGPLVVEIGTNRGRFLAAHAHAHPECQHLGIELRKKYATQAQKRCVREGLTNAQVFCGDANLVLPIAVAPKQIRAFFLICPDPWWKLRHEKRRIIQPDFLNLLSEKMEDGGRLYIRTDVGMLAEWMRQNLDEHPDFTPLKPADYPSEVFPLSTRERHVIAYGMPMYPLYYQRVTRI